MKQIHIDRLLKLADHLEHGQLGHKVFNFDHYNVGEGEKVHHSPSCGYAGCAIGECPIVFPGEWVYKDSGWPHLIGQEWLYASIEYFFGVDGDESAHLFIPYRQLPMRYCGHMLDKRATKEEVAANIRAFVALKLPNIEK